MKLHEIADNDFEEPERTPVQMYDRVVNRASSLKKQTQEASALQSRLMQKIPREDITDLNGVFGVDLVLATDSSIPNKKAEGYLPVYNHRHDHSGTWKKYVRAWIKITPQNQSVVKQLAHANRIAVHAEESELENDKLIKQYKAKYQAWARKQPGYVKRDEAKDLAKELASDIMAFCKSQFMMEPNLIQQNFWKKGNKFVVQLGFHEKPQNGKTLWNKLKEVIIPQLKDHLKSNGLVGSIKTDYHSPDATDLTMFIDAQEVLAKQKDDNENI